MKAEEKAEQENAIRESVKSRFSDQIGRLKANVVVNLEPQQCKIAFWDKNRPIFTFLHETPEKAMDHIEEVFLNL